MTKEELQNKIKDILKNLRYIQGSGADDRPTQAGSESPVQAREERENWTQIRNNLIDQLKTIGRSNPQFAIFWENFNFQDRLYYRQELTRDSKIDPLITKLRDTKLDNETSGAIAAFWCAVMVDLSDDQAKKFINICHQLIDNISHNEVNAQRNTSRLSQTRPDNAQGLIDNVDQQVDNFQNVLVDQTNREEFDRGKDRQDFLSQIESLLIDGIEVDNNSLNLSDNESEKTSSTPFVSAEFSGDGDSQDRRSENTDCLSFVTSDSDGPPDLAFSPFSHKGIKVGPHPYGAYKNQPRDPQNHVQVGSKNDGTHKKQPGDRDPQNHVQVGSDPHGTDKNQHSTQPQQCWFTMIQGLRGGHRTDDKNPIQNFKDLVKGDSSSAKNHLIYDQNDNPLGFLKEKWTDKDNKITFELAPKKDFTIGDKQYTAPLFRRGTYSQNRVYTDDQQYDFESLSRLIMFVEDDKQDKEDKRLDVTGFSKDEANQAIELPNNLKTQLMRRIKDNPSKISREKEGVHIDIDQFITPPLVSYLLTKQTNLQAVVQDPDNKNELIEANDKNDDQCLQAIFNSYIKPQIDKDLKIENDDAMEVFKQLANQLRSVLSDDIDKVYHNPNDYTPEKPASPAP